MELVKIFSLHHLIVAALVWSVFVLRDLIFDPISSVGRSIAITAFVRADELVGERLKHLVQDTPACNELLQLTTL